MRENVTKADDAISDDATSAINDAATCSAIGDVTVMQQLQPRQSHPRPFILTTPKTTTSEDDNHCDTLN